MPKTVAETPGCLGCPMKEKFPRNTFVAPQMPLPSRDLIRICIAEAPGEQEDKEGKPLVGGAGAWFDSLLRAAHIDRAGLTICNTIQCRPPGNVYPMDSDARSYISREDADKAVRQCLRNHVVPLLRSRDWKRVDLFGEKALRLIAGKHEGISKWRGSPLEIDIDKIET